MIWRQLAWYSHPAVSENFSNYFLPFLAIINLGIPMVFYLKYLSQFKWLKRNPSLSISYKRAFLVVMLESYGLTRDHLIGPSTTHDKSNPLGTHETT